MSPCLRILLTLTAEDGETVYVNPPHVRAVVPLAKGARLEFSEGNGLTIRERADVVAGQIDRWLSAAYLGERHDR